MDLIKIFAVLALVAVAAVSCQDDNSTQAEVTYTFYKDDDNVIGGVNLLPTRESFAEAGFDKSLPTVIFVHGYFYGLSVVESDSMKNAYILLRGDQINYIEFDWTPLLETDGIAGGVEVATANLTVFMKFMVAEIGVRPSDIQLFGLNFGAEIAGLSGNQFQDPRVGILTAFDPSSRDFRGDASVSVVYHSTELSEGASGDVDIYLNGGNLEFGNIVEDHHAAMGLYVTSIEDEAGKCKWTATQCYSYRAFKGGECDGNPTNKMGYEFDREGPAGKLFIEVTSDMPDKCGVDIDIEEL